MTGAPGNPPSGRELRVVAFGMEVECDWPLPGSGRARALDRRALPRTRVHAAGATELDAAWAAPARRVLEPPAGHDAPGYTIDLGEHDYLYWLEGRGRYLVSLDGAQVRYEAGADEPPLRERFVLAQALPVAALMHGYEVLHASAVAGPTGAVGFTGPSGVGKTTIAACLLARGASFLCDDVLSIEPRDGEVLAHSGPGFMAIRDADAMAISPDVSRLGKTIGSSDKLHIAARVAAEAAPLRALYHLEPGESFEILPLARAHLGRSLGTVFAPYVMTPGRLRRHLEMGQLLAREVRQLRLVSPRTGMTEPMIEALQEHVAETTG